MICKFFNKLFGGEDNKQEPTKEDKKYFSVLDVEQYLYKLGYVKVLPEDVELSIYDAFFIQSES